MKKIFNSAFSLYAYSFVIAIAFSFFIGEFYLQETSADNFITALSAKLALTPFYWEDSRIGGLTSYLMSPFSFLNIYQIYIGEIICKCALVAILPVILIMIADKRSLGYFLIPSFYLVSYYNNSFMRESIVGGTFYYYPASFSLFFVAQFLYTKILNNNTVKFYCCAVVAFILCLIAYWVNLSLIIFVLPYLFYLLLKKEIDKNFILLNILSFIPPFALSKIVEIWGKSYTKFSHSLTMPFVMLKKLFFHNNYSDVVGAVFLILTCVAIIFGFIKNSSKQNTYSNKKFQTFFIATIFGLAVFLIVSSQLWYVKINYEASERYITIWMIFIAFFMPLILWEKVTSLSIFNNKARYSKALAIIVLSVNLAVFGIITIKFTLPQVNKSSPTVIELIKIAKAENVNVIMAGNDSIVASYWSVWPVFFHSLAESGSVTNSVIPITQRCTAIADKIDLSLSVQSSFKVLCVGGDIKECRHRTTDCGFFYFNDHPKIIKEIVMKIPYENDKKIEVVPISILEYSRDNNDVGNLINVLNLHSPAELTKLNSIHIPKNPDPFLATYGPMLALLPGDYRISIHCAVSEHANDNDAIGSLKVTLNDHNNISKQINLKAEHGVVHEAFTFNVPDFKFFTPRAQFLLFSYGKADLDCNEFRITPIK